jgi:PIN domain nuclease of toxin-antitoxin system
MKYLLDTMVWLWSVGPSGLEILASAEKEIYFSAASSWEIVVKTKLGKVRLPEVPGRYVPKRLAEQGIRSLPINQSHSLRIYDLPLHHFDPFDRMIIAQAMVGEMTVLTSDRSRGDSRPRLSRRAKLASLDAFPTSKSCVGFQNRCAPPDSRGRLSPQGVAATKKKGARHPAEAIR